MAKLTIKVAKELVESGYMSQESYDELVGKGEISSGKRGGGKSAGPREVMQAKDGALVVPSFYFAGLGRGTSKDKLTDIMIELRSKVEGLIAKYVVPETEFATDKVAEVAEPTE